MPYIYCTNCEEGIDDWQEAFRGCKHCGHEYWDIDDPDARSIMRALLDEIDTLKEELKDLKRDFMRLHTNDHDEDEDFHF